jgi:hypothetical protein
MGWKIENALEASVMVDSRDRCNESTVPRLLVVHGANMSVMAIVLMCLKIKVLQVHKNRYSNSQGDLEYPRDILRLFVHKISNPKDKCKDRSGCTASSVVEAIRIDNEHNTLLLLERGADANL